MAIKQFIKVAKEIVFPVKKKLILPISSQSKKETKQENKSSLTKETN
jgi:hypothetical protein